MERYDLNKRETKWRIVIKTWSPSSANIALVANGELTDPSFTKALLERFPTIVAIDGGLHHCERMGITPSLIIGDFDSTSSLLRNTFQHVPQIETSDQNKTDLEKALEFLIPFHPNSISVFLALGKRLDHTLTNVCLLTRYPGKVIFEASEERIWALEKTTLLTNCRPGQTLSLIPFNGEVKGITTQGLKWELTKGKLDKYFVGISNQCLSNHVTISFLSGDLVLCLQR